MLFLDIHFCQNLYSLIISVLILDDNFAVIVILKSVTGHHNYFPRIVASLRRRILWFTTLFFFLQLSSKIGVKMLFLDFPYRQFCIALSSVLFEEIDPYSSINL